jgi:gliding motility-associated-like protein
VIGTPIINNVSCNGANDGSITISPTGGTGSLTSTWNTVPATVGNTVTGLAPGSYTVVVTDQGGCSATATYSITQPTVLAVTVDATAVLCFGSTSGTATANATGGTVPSYTYHWNDNQATQTISNLPVGIVLVTVTDGNGCTASGSAIIGQSPAISYNSQINQPNCSTLGFGTEILTPRGGTGAIRITINEPGLTLDTTLPMVGADTVLIYPGVPTGCYDFTLTDAIGCSITGNFCVNAGAAGQTFTATTTPTSCFGKGFNDGSIVVTPGTNANAPYSYSLGGAAYQPDSIYNNVGAGTYTVYVTNSYGCLDSIVATVDQPAQLLVNATPDTIVTGANVGNQINVTVTNYTNPVYTWTPVAGLSCTDCSNPLATVAVNSVFYVQVSEDGVEGCYASDSVVIIVNGKLKMPNAFSPNTDGKNDTYGPVNGENSALTITAFRIYNRWGQEVHNAAENWNGKFKGEDQPAGTYVYYISVKTPDENNPGQDKTVTDQGAFTLLR